MAIKPIEIAITAKDEASSVLRRLADDLQRAAGQATGALKPALESAANELRRMDAEGDKASAGLDKMAVSGNRLEGALQRVGGLLASAFAAREIVAAAADMETLSRGMESVFGSAQAAGQEMDYVRQLASRTGAEAVATGQAWLGMAAATRGTAVEGEAARQVFEAVAISMGKAGKTSAETKNALVALQQIASKGTVSMEELRGQLGEALPGALQAASSGMGITTQDLIKLVETGQLTAGDLFPALAKGLNDLYGGAPQAQTLSQEIINIKNAIVDLGADLGQAGGLDALKTGAELAQAAIVLLDASLVSAGKTIGVLAGAAATLDFSGLKQAFTEIEAEANDKLAKAAQHNETLRGYIGAVGNEAIQTALKTQQAAATVQQSAQAAAAAGDDYQKLAVGYQKVRDYLAEQVELSDAEVKASKARGDAAVAQAKLLGDEVQVRQAVGAAAAAQAQVLEDLADRRRTEVQTLQAQAQAMRDEMAASGVQSDQRRKQLAELDQLISKKAIEADASRAQAAAARANAQAVGEEAQAATAARESAEAMRITRVADARASMELLQAQKSLAGQSAEMASLMGNESAAREFRIQQMRVDIQITRAKADVQRAEAEGSIAVAQASLEELRVKGQLTPVKEAELNASIKLAQAKLKEADAVRQSARVTEQAIKNLRGFGDVAGRAGHIGHAAGQKAAQGWREAAAAVAEASEETQKYDAFMKSRFERGWAKNEDGSTVVAAVSQAEINQDVARLFGEKNIGNKDAELAAYYKRRLDAAEKNGVHQSARGYFDDLRKEFQRLSEQLLRGGSAEPASKSGETAQRSTQRPAPDEPRTGGGSGVSAGQNVSYITNLTLADGRRATVRLADAESQAGLTALLEQLAADKRRAA